MSTTPFVAFPLVLSEGQVHKLQLDHEPNLVAQDPDRFATLQCDGDVDDFASDATLIWCDSVLSSLIVLNFERAAGFRAALLWDQDEKNPHHSHVVLSSRPFNPANWRPLEH